MRTIVSIFAASLLFLATHANADQQTLSAIEKAGGTLTEAEASALKDIQCQKPNPNDGSIVSDSCQSLIDQVAELIANYSTDDAMIEAILTGAVEAHPELAQQFADAGMAVAPDAIAQIASLILELAPTAAGPSSQLAAINVTNNIPTPSGGGNSSSPN